MLKRLSINTKVIAALNPCRDRFNNWLKHYEAADLDILEFLALDEITASDKIWVSVRVLPIQLVEIFAIDCAVKTVYTAGDYADAAAYAAALYADDAVAANADAAAFAATTVTAAYDAERELQIDALAYLVMLERGET